MDPTIHTVAESPAVVAQPWKATSLPLGAAGVNLAKSIQSLDPNELARLTNAVPTEAGGLETRNGLTRVVTLGTNVHSVIQANFSATSFTGFWGIDANWVRGVNSGAGMAILEGGFSGNPLSMVAWEAEFGAVERVYVADANKMRQAGLTSVSQGIGLAKPAAPTVTVPAKVKTAIAAFDASDGTQASAWTGLAGLDDAGTGTAGTPNIIDDPGVSGNCVVLETQVGTATTSYISWMALPKVMNLDVLGGVVASDDDIIHVFIRVDLPQNLTDVRIYFVCSPFGGGPLFPIPGTDPQFNTSAYMRSFRPSDYTAFVAGQATALQAAGTVRQSALLEGYNDPIQTEATDPSTATLAGANVFAEYGRIDLPLRRSDFLKIGSAGVAGTDWSTVTGIIIAARTSGAVSANVAFDDAYLTGGGNVDDAEPDAQGFDYRLINYDTVTGAKSNPSDVQTTTVDALRQKVTVQGVPFGRASVRQWAFRRGGSLTDNWYLTGKSTTDGGAIIDNTTDIAALAAGTVEIDNDQPITSEDVNGNAIYNQPVPILFGPVEGYLFALGDPNRPGHLYWCKQNQPDHWPAANHEAVCPTAEILQNGGKYGGQGFVFSLERMYSIQINLIDGSVTTQPTDCAEGLAARYGMCVFPGGIGFVSRDAVRVTRGGESITISDAIRPLFRAQSKNGYNPIDWNFPSKIRLVPHGDELWFGFQDTGGAFVWWVYWLLGKTWRCVDFTPDCGMVYSRGTSSPGGLSLVVGSLTGGTAYTHDGFTDDGVAISASFRTGALAFQDDRAEKLFGDVAVWGNMYGSTLSVQAFFNAERSSNIAMDVVGTSLNDRYVFDLFGVQPQHAMSLSLGVSWSGSLGGFPTIDKLSIDTVIQPEVTINRATTWQPLNESGEAYLTGMWIDSDTGGSPRTILVEGLLNGTPVAVATLTVNSSAGRRQWFSWAAVHVDMVRLRPTGACEPWILFGSGWQFRPEPPRQALWDTGFEMLGDTYYTGVDIECDTFNVAKTLSISVDGVVVATPTIQTNGRALIHITLPTGRGHLYRFTATDGNLGLLYSHKWIVDMEPGEQANWNQNYTIAGTRSDKFLKGILLECDTFNQAKTVTIEVDGVVVSTQSVTANGRKVVHIAFSQALGRVFRVIPTDTNPGRLYSVGWLFDEEPYQLTRYETQEQPNSFKEFHLPVDGQICLKSSASVTMNVKGYGQDGTLLSNKSYVFASTAGVKAMKWLGAVLEPQKGLLFKFVFTSAVGFWLYREESWITLQPWSGGATKKLAVFGDDDLDPTRGMTNAESAAKRSGGMAT